MHFCLSPVVDIMANCKAFALKQIKFRICWPTNSLLTDLLTASVKCSSLLFAPLWWNLDTVGGTGPYGGAIVRYWGVFLVLQSQFLATKGKATSKLLLLYYASLKSLLTLLFEKSYVCIFFCIGIKRERGWETLGKDDIFIGFYFLVGCYCQQNSCEQKPNQFTAQTK